MSSSSYRSLIYKVLLTQLPLLHWNMYTYFSKSRRGEGCFFFFSKFKREFILWKNDDLIFIRDFGILMYYFQVCLGNRKLENFDPLRERVSWFGNVNFCSIFFFSDVFPKSHSKWKKNSFSLTGSKKVKNQNTKNFQEKFF